MSQPKVCLGNINAGQLSVGFVNSLVQSNNLNLFDKYILHPNGPYLDMGRNTVVREFLKTDCDYLLFIDSDVVWETNDLVRLYENLSPHHVIGGYYLNPYPEGIRPVVYEWQRRDPEDIEAWNLFSISEEELLDMADSDGIAMCTTIGTGFMCIPRAILDVIGAKYTAPCEYFAQPIFKGLHLGEDLAFCLRVWDAGFPVLMDTKVKLRHAKNVWL